MKCDKVGSLAMSSEEWALVERIAELSQTSKNDFIRRCIHHGLNSLLIAGLCPVSVDTMLKEARSELLTPPKVRALLARHY